MPQGITDSPSYFLQSLKTNFDDILFPKGSTLLQHVDDLLLCSSSQVSLQDDSIHLLTSLALKGHKVSKEKLQFAQAHVQYLGHLILEQGLNLDPDRLHDIISFPMTKPKCQLRGFLGQVGYCRNLIPNFCLTAKLLHALLKNDSPDPISWKEWDGIAFKALKESLINPHSLGDPTRFLSSFLCIKWKEMPLACSLRNTGNNINP